MIRICFLTRMLDEGGAQRQLVTLIENLDSTRFDTYVMTFYDGGRFCEQVKRMPHVNYVCLRKRGRWDIVRFSIALYRQLRRIRPELLHGYMPMANCLAALLKPFLRNTRVVWGLRASDMDYSKYDRLSRCQHRLERLLAPSADLIIVNSYSGLEHAAAHGYPRDRMRVVPNGIDVGRFHPNPEARVKIRREWGIKDHEVLVGLVGRVDPMKDLPTFLNAAAVFAQARDDSRFAIVGDGPEDYRRQVVEHSGRLGIAHRLIWAGSRPDMPDVYNAFDLACSSSVTEGFPNAVGEAMACGIPCVVTNVGDSARIVHDATLVVPPRDPRALADAWRECLGRRTEQTARQARSRIQELFSVKNLVQQTEAALNEMARS